MMESAITQKVMRQIKERWPQAFVVKLSDKYSRGLPDVLAIVKGVCLFIEVKTDIGILSPIQVVTHDRIINAGGDVYLLQGMEAIPQILNDIDWVVEKRLNP